MYWVESVSMKRENHYVFSYSYNILYDLYVYMKKTILATLKHFTFGISLKKVVSLVATGNWS